MIVIAMATVGILALVLAVYFAYKNNPLRGFEMTFPGVGCDFPFPCEEKVYDLEELNKQIEKETPVYIYAFPELTDFQVVKQLGVDDVEENRYEPITKERIYSFDEATLSVDKYGSFYFETGAQTTLFPFPYSDKETMEFARQVLEEYNLWSDSFSRWSTNTIKSQTSEGVDILEKEIVFWLRSDDGRDMLNNKVHVAINGNKELVSIMYDVKKYSKRTKANLISIEEAFKRIDEGKARYSYNISQDHRFEKDIFETVEIKYREEENERGEYILQPVYVFSGTAVNDNGEKATFTYTVQANKVG